MRYSFHPAALLIAFAAMRLLSPPGAAAQVDTSWDDRFSYPGVNGLVRASAWYHGDLYIAGDFTEAGGIPVNHIARWDGRAWRPLLGGLTAGPVLTVAAALTVYDGDLIVGGFFSHADTSRAIDLARWDGSTWSGFMGGVNGEVDALLAVNNDLYVAGTIFTAGSMDTTGGMPPTGPISVRRVARWDGSAWSALGSGIGTTSNDARVYALAHDGTYLYAGGDMFLAGGVEVENLARWDGAAWSALGAGADATVYALAVFDGALYAGGLFSDIGDVLSPRLARWTGGTWEHSGTVVGTAVRSLVVGDGLYAGGLFSEIGGVGPNVVRYDGDAWTALGSGVSSTVYTVAVDGGAVAAAGSFGSAGARIAHSVSIFEDDVWRALGQGVEGRVLVVQPADGGYYVGGEFTVVGGTPALNIAFWDGASWSPVGSGVDGIVHAMVQVGGRLYVGGDFDRAGGEVIHKVAVWDGGSWSAVGDGFGGACLALAADENGMLYAGGTFNKTGETSIGRIARWNGATWVPVGEGIPAPGTVNDIVLQGNMLYAGGDFLLAGGNSAANVARYFDGQWSALGTGVNGPVLDLDVSPAGVYAAGDFNRAGGADANGLALWNGETWDAEFTSGIGGRPITAVAALGSDSLYIAGEFENILGEPARHIALWNGGSWSALGDGIEGEIAVLTLDGDYLWVGGTFDRAGEVASHNIARWNPQGTVAVELLALNALRSGDGVELTWRIADPEGDLVGFHVYRETPAGTRDRLTDAPLFAGDTYRFVDADAPAGTARYWLYALTRTGAGTWFGPAEVSAVPAARLLSSRPNPFHGSTRIVYTVLRTGPVRLEVFDLAGRVVRTLDDNVRTPGEYRLDWNGRDDHGVPVGAGVFFYRLHTPGADVTRKIVALP